MIKEGPMKRRHRNKKRPMRMIRLWTHTEAEKALPYLRSVVGSLREHWLTAQCSKRTASLLDARPGASKRERILATQRAREDGDRAEMHFQDALAELSSLDVFLIDPVRGLALIPFRKDEDLAWFIYDQFEQNGLVGWRMHEDPLEQRRPLALLDESVAPSDPASN